MHADGRLSIPDLQFRRERDAIRAAIDEEGFRDGSYVGAFGEEWADASLLVMARLGYLNASHPRVASTAERIWRELGRDGLLLRYGPEVDGISSREGTFGICAFWAVELFAAQGKLGEAEELFNRACLLANDVGLLAKEYDPATREALGNVPQAFTHAGLISAATALARAQSAQPRA